MGHPRSDAAFLTLAAEIRDEISLFEKTVSETTRAIDAHTEENPEVAIVLGIAMLIHDFYSSIERILNRVVRGLNGVASEGPDWHRDLLRQARLDIPGVRPHVITAESATRLDEIRRFRHLVRNLYAFDLDWQRVRMVASSLPETSAMVKTDLDQFAEFLTSLEISDPLT